MMVPAPPARRRRLGSHRCLLGFVSTWGFLAVVQAAEPATNEPLPTAETVLKSLIESGPKETEAGEQFEEHRDDVVKVR